MEFRPATESEMPDFRKIGDYVFVAPNSDDRPPVPTVDPSWTHCAFDEDRLVASSAVYPFIVRLNGATAPVHGVTAVGTEPTYRRRGIVRRLITDLLHRAKDEGQVASMLLASMGAIYQRFGYGLASAYVRYEFDPREAVFQQPIETGGRCERIDSKESAFPIIKSVFRTHVKERNLMALRAEAAWDQLLRDLDKNRTSCVVHFDDSGVPDAYCVYSMKYYDRQSAGPDQQLTIDDFAYSNMTGYRAVWEYLLSHDLVGKIDWNNVPEDDPAPGLLLEPRCLNRRIGDGIWFRVVDLPALLTARRYDVDGSITLKLDDDDLCPWNNGTWSLVVRNGEASVEQSKGDADVTCSIISLGSLISGYSNMSYLARIGRVQAREEASLASFDALFSTQYRPALSFGF